MKTKVCSRCKQEKSKSEFFLSRRAKDSLQDWCKTCKLSYQRSPTGKESKKKSGKKYRQSPAGREAQKKSDKKQRLKFPEKEKARQAVKYAVGIGGLIRPWYCELCFITCQPEAHHLDYSKPLEVEWLCFDCHKKLHKREDVMEFIREVG